jgi:hypothetical protein
VKYLAALAFLSLPTLPILLASGFHREEKLFSGFALAASWAVAIAVIMR